MNKRVGAIDLGSNTVRLLVAEGDASSYTTLFSDQVITRLGEGLSRNNFLAPNAIRRTVRAVATMLKRAEEYRPFDLTIFATSAAREAKNSDDLRRAMNESAGAAITIINQQREAELALRGTIGGIGKAPPSFVLFDIGGGSTEFILWRGDELAGVAGSDLGVVRLAETYLTCAPTNAAEYKTLCAEIDTKVDEAFNNLGVDEIALIGTAGTVTSLAAIALGLKKYDPMAINGFVLTAARLDDLKQELMKMTLPERSVYPSLTNGREDLIIPGVAIIEAALRRSRQKQLLVSDDGLREGLIRELLAS